MQQNMQKTGIVNIILFLLSFWWQLFFLLKNKNVSNNIYFDDFDGFDEIMKNIFSLRTSFEKLENWLLNRIISKNSPKIISAVLKLLTYFGFQPANWTKHFNNHPILFKWKKSLANTQ